MAITHAALAQRSAGAGGGIRTPDRLITNQLLYRAELRQPDKNGSVARPMPPMQGKDGQGLGRCPGPPPEVAVSGKMPSGFPACGDAAARASRDSRFPAPPSGWLRNLRGRPRENAAATRPSRHHPRRDLRPRPPSRRDNLAGLRRPSGRRGRQQLDVRPVRFGLVSRGAGPRLRGGARRDGS